MSRERFEQALSSIHHEVLDMASITEQAIDDAITALVYGDKELAQKIIAGDDRVDEMERMIERRCVEVIATQQPIAGDLRFITAILKMVTDLERIADHAADISELVLEFSKEETRMDLKKISAMANMATDMVKDAINAYVYRDAALADSVIQKDETVDADFTARVAHIQSLCIENTDLIPDATRILFIIKYIERIADHATNIAEWAKYNIEGWQK